MDEELFDEIPEKVEAIKRNRKRKKEVVAEDIVVETQVPESQAAPTSLLDKTLALAGITLQAKNAKQSKGSTASKPLMNLVNNALPMLLASACAVYVSSWPVFDPPYQECSPTQDECRAVLQPLFDQLGRYIKIHVGINRNSWGAAITESLLQAATYGVRVWITVQVIQRTPHAPRRDRPGTYSERTSDRSSEYDTFDDRVSQYTPTATRSMADDSIPSGSVNGDDTGTDASRVADLLRKDRFGREQMGLIPRRIPTNGSN